MATAVLPITGCWYSDGGNGRWTEATYIWCGRDSAYYRSKIAVSTEGLTIVNSEKLVLSVAVSGLSSPFGMECILTKDGTILANDCYSTSLTGASDTLNEAAISRSFAYADEGCTTLLSKTEGVNMAAGERFWLCFDGAQLEQDQTYYLYFIRYVRDGYTGTGWVQADVEDMSCTLTYTNYTACTAPAWVTVTPEIFESVVRIQWDGAQAGQSNPITGYQIQAKYSDDKVSWSGWEDVGITEQSFLELTPDVARGSYVGFAVRTLGQAGEEFYSQWYISEECSACRNRLPGIPGDVVATAVVASGGEMELRWSAAEDPDGQACSYIVGRKEAEGWVEQDRTQALVFSQIAEGQPGDVVQYAVRALDEAGGLSDWSEVVSVTINRPPVAPTQVELERGVYSPGETITVFWGGAEDADGNLAGFEIHYVVEGSQEAVLLASVDAQPGGSGKYSFQPDQLEYGQRMELAVRAVDTLGAVSDFAHSGWLKRSDEPHAHIFEKGAAGNFVPVAGGNRYMPYIRVDGQWVRHPGAR